MENHTQNVVGKLFSDHFLKKSKLSISLDEQSKVLRSLFLLSVQVEDYCMSKSRTTVWPSRGHIILNKVVDERVYYNLTV